MHIKNKIFWQFYLFFQVDTFTKLYKNYISAISIYSIKTSDDCIFVCFAGKRPKKGQATAKQRLGKILKMSRHKGLFL